MSPLDVPAEPGLDAALCRVTARWLSACARGAGALGLGCALLAAGVLLWRAGSPPGAARIEALLCAAVLLLTLPERVLALRLMFDAGLFADLAAPGASLQSLDAALTALQLRTAATGPVRSLPDRVAGARRLSHQHLAVVALQVMALVIAFIVLLLQHG